MMETMRNAAKSWVAKLLIGLLAVSFGVWGIADVFRGYSSTALVTVGKSEITPQEFSQAFNQYLQNFSRQTGQGVSPEDARKLGIDRGVLNNLIQSAAIDNEAVRMKLAVSDSALAQEVMENPAFQSNGKFDSEQFKRLLAQNGINEGMFFADQRRNRLREALTETVDGTIPVSKALVEAQYRFRNEQRDARYFVVKTSESEVEAPTDAEIKKEYDGNPALFTAPEYRSIAVMKVEPTDVAAKVELSDEDIKAGYEKYKVDYFTPEKRTILQLSFPNLEEAKAAKTKLDGGADFMALAKERGVSEADMTFADQTKADFIDPAIADAAFALKEGTVSEPVKGGLATVLLKAVKVTPERQAPLEDVKAQLADRLKLDRAKDEIQSVYDAVEDARAAQTKFEDIAAKAGIPFQLIAETDARGLGPDGKAIAMPHQAELIKAAFNSDVGVENDAISVDDGYVWYEVREVKPAAVKPFDTVKDQAKAQVVADKERALSEDKAKKLLDRLKSGAAMEDLAKEAGAEVKTQQGLKRGESDAVFDPPAVQAIFAVPENGYAFAVEPDGKGAKIMQSQAVLLQAFDANAPEAKQISEAMQTASANDILGAYLASMQKEAGVTINETLWRQIAGQSAQ